MTLCFHPWSAVTGCQIGDSNTGTVNICEAAVRREGYLSLLASQAMEQAEQVCFPGGLAWEARPLMIAPQYASSSRMTQVQKTRRLPCLTLSVRTPAYIFPHA